MILRLSKMVTFEFRTFNTSPDGQNLLKIVSAQDDSILLDNLGDVPFGFTVTGFVNDDLHVYVQCEYDPNSESIEVNNS